MMGSKAEVGNPVGAHAQICFFLTGRAGYILIIEISGYLWVAGKAGKIRMFAYLSMSAPYNKVARVAKISISTSRALNMLRQG